MLSTEHSSSLSLRNLPSTGNCSAVLCTVHANLLSVVFSVIIIVCAIVLDVVDNLFSSTWLKILLFADSETFLSFSSSNKIAFSFWSARILKFKIAVPLLIFPLFVFSNFLFNGVLFLSSNIIFSFSFFEFIMTKGKFAGGEFRGGYKGMTSGLLLVRVVREKGRGDDSRSGRWVWGDVIPLTGRSRVNVASFFSLTSSFTSSTFTPFPFSPSLSPFTFSPSFSFSSSITSNINDLAVAGESVILLEADPLPLTFPKGEIIGDPASLRTGNSIEVLAFLLPFRTGDIDRDFLASLFSFFSISFSQSFLFNFIFSTSENFVDPSAHSDVIKFSGMFSAPVQVLKIRQWFWFWFWFWLIFRGLISFFIEAAEGALDSIRNIVRCRRYLHCMNIRVRIRSVREELGDRRSIKKKKKLMEK